jgi:hypothetical protein
VRRVTATKGKTIRTLGKSNSSKTRSSSNKERRIIMEEEC